MVKKNKIPTEVEFKIVDKALEDYYSGGNVGTTPYTTSVAKAVQTVFTYYEDELEGLNEGMDRIESLSSFTGRHVREVKVGLDIAWGRLTHNIHDLTPLLLK